MHFFFMRLLVLAGLFLAFAAPAHAVTVNTTQAINFGTWFIPGNAGAYSVTINTDGSSSNSPQLVRVRSPQKGIYVLGDLPINTVINSLDFSQGQALTTAGGEVFTMTSFQSDSPLVTDGVGDLPLVLGATVETSGNGSGYGRGVFTGQINVEINY